MYCDTEGDTSVCTAFEEIPDDGEIDCVLKDNYYYPVSGNNKCFKNCLYFSASIDGWSNNYCINPNTQQGFETFLTLYPGITVSEIIDGGSDDVTETIAGTLEGCSTTLSVGVAEMGDCPAGCVYIESIDDSNNFCK